MKKVLITGGAGFIGSNLSLALIDKGYQVSVLDSLSKQIHGEDPQQTSPLYQSIKDKVTFIRSDIRNRELLSMAIKDVSAIIHLAAETGTGQSMYQIEHYTNVNIGGTALLLDILSNEQHNVRKLIVASSRSIYGEGKYLSEQYGIVYPPPRSAEHMSRGDFNVKYLDSRDLTVCATDEESKIHPSSIYGITKQVQEQLVMTMCPAINIAPVALRYQNVYGPGQALSNPYTGILSIFSTRIKNNNDINIFEDGKESRDFVFISDVIRATVLCLEKEEANGQVFNVGSGRPVDVLKVAHNLIDAYGHNVPIKVSGNYRLGDIRHNYAELKKITNTLGFIPQVEFEKGIKIFAEWVNSQSHNVDHYDKSIEEMRRKGFYK